MTMRSNEDKASANEDSSRSWRRVWGARLRELHDALWGYDFFISYAQSDGQAYPSQLKAALDQPKLGKGFSVFLDTEDGFRAGDDLRIMTRRRVRSSVHFVVIGREHALSRSKWVPQEASNYIEAQILRESGLIPIIININCALESARANDLKEPCLASRGDLDSWLRIDESLSLNTEKPSDQTIEKLVSSHRGVRRETLRARIFGILALIFLLLALGAALLGEVAWLARRTSQINLADAQLNLAESWRTEGRLNQASAYAAEALSVRESDAARRFLLENPPATLVEVIPVSGGRVSALAVSYEGLMAVGDKSGQFRLFDLAGGSRAPIREFPLGESEISKIAFSKAGDKIAVSQLNGAVWLLDAKGAPAAAPVYRTNPGNGSDPLVMNQLAFLADGRLAIVADALGADVLQLIDAAGKPSGAPLEVTMKGYGVSDMVSHPRLPRLAVLYANGALSTVDFSGGKAPTRTEIRRDFPVGETFAGGVSGWSLAFDPAPERVLANDKGDRFVVGLGDASVWLLDAKGEPLKRVAFPSPAENSPLDPVNDVRFTTDGNRLLALRASGAVGVFQRSKEWRLERVIEGYGSSDQDVFMACCIGDALAVTASFGRAGGDLVKVWDISTADRLWTMRLAGKYGPKDANITSLAFDEPGKRLAIGTSSGQIAVLDRETRTVVAVSPGHDNDQKVTSVTFGRGQHKDSIFAAAWGRPLYLWALTTCDARELINRQESDMSLYAVGWDRTRAGLVIAPFSDQNVTQFILAEPTAGHWSKFRSEAFEDRIEQLFTFEKRSAVIGIAANAKHFYYWTPNLPRAEKIAIGDGLGLSALAATPDGSVILASANNRIRRWRLNDNGLIPLPDLPCAPAHGLSCSAWQLAIDPRGRWFAATKQNEIYIRRVSDGAFLARLTAHHGQIDALATPPSGDALASGGMDGQVILWDLRVLLDDPEQVRALIQLSAGFSVGPSGLVELTSAAPHFKASLSSMGSAHETGRVEMWCGGGRLSLSVSGLDHHSGHTTVAALPGYVVRERAALGSNDAHPQCDAASPTTSAWCAVDRPRRTGVRRSQLGGQNDDQGPVSDKVGP